MKPVLDHALVARFDPIKGLNEKILWIGKPALLPYMFAGWTTGLWNIGFSALWIGITLNATKDAANPDFMWKYFWIFGLISPVVGLWSWTKRMWAYPHTFYACSDQHILIRTSPMNFKVIPHRSITEMKVSINVLEKLFQTGTLKFFSGNTHTDNENNVVTRIYDYWEAIPNPHEVFRHVKECSTQPEKAYVFE